MTTETARRAPGAPSGAWGPLLAAAGLALVCGLLATLLGAVLTGSGAAFGALAGTGFVLAVFAFGSFAVQAVAQLMPAASLLFALLTYTLQVALMALVFVALTRSGALDGPLDREWFAGTIIVGAMGWILGQVVLTTRARIPAYDLTEASR